MCVGRNNIRDNFALERRKDVWDLGITELRNSEIESNLLFMLAYKWRAHNRSGEVCFVDKTIRYR